MHSILHNTTFCMRKENSFYFVYRATIAIFTMLAVATGVDGQSYSVVVKAVDRDDRPVRLEKLTVQNLSKQWMDTIVNPDSAIIFTNTTGIEELDVDDVAIVNPMPNPFHGITQVCVRHVVSGSLKLVITDMRGRVVMTHAFECMHSGDYLFRVSLEETGVHVLTVRQKGKKHSVKLLNTGKGNGNSILHLGMKSDGDTPRNVKSASRSSIVRPIDATDRIRYIGYFTHNGELVESLPVTQILTANYPVMLHFITTQTGTPCDGIPTVMDVDGNVYNTVQVGDQCWMRENMRVTHFANGDTIPMKSDAYGWWYYRYPPNGDTANVSMFGYLYDWNAALYNFSGSNPCQGVCPTGWHVPTYDELNTMLNFVKSKNWFWCDNNGLFYAKALADSVGWAESSQECAPGASTGPYNMSGFSARPAGMFNGSDTYASFGSSAFFWSSTKVPSQYPYQSSHSAYYRRIDNVPIVSNPVGGSGESCAHSVRCLRD